MKAYANSILYTSAAPMSIEKPRFYDNKNSPVKTGGISFSDIALILLATHKCAFYWPASHAIVTYYP